MQARVRRVASKPAASRSWSWRTGTCRWCGPAPSRTTCFPSLTKPAVSCRCLLPLPLWLSLPWPSSTVEFILQRANGVQHSLSIVHLTAAAFFTEHALVCGHLLLAAKSQPLVCAGLLSDLMHACSGVKFYGMTCILHPAQELLASMCFTCLCVALAQVTAATVGLEEWGSRLPVFVEDASVIAFLQARNTITHTPLILPTRDSMTPLQYGFLLNI